MGGDHKNFILFLKVPPQKTTFDLENIIKFNKSCKNE